MKKLIMCEDLSGGYIVGEVNTECGKGIIIKNLSREKAEFFVVACNEHKKLKAKEALLNKVMPLLKWIFKNIEGDAWCTIRENKGADEWVDGCKLLLSKPKKSK